MEMISGDVCERNAWRGVEFMWSSDMCWVLEEEEY